MNKCGKLIVICGSMYSGKSEELQRQMKRSTIAGIKNQLFKPSLDDRYTKDAVETHDKIKLPAIVVKNSLHLLSLIEDDTKIIGIDEIQFFDEEIVTIVDSLINKGKTIIVSGLDMTSEGEPFGVMPILLCKANYVKKLQAVCVDCGEDAWISYAITKKKGIVDVGSHDKYIALCRECNNKRGR